MRAILRKMDKGGNVKTVGCDGVIITQEYKSIAALRRYAINPALRRWEHGLIAEVWYNWDSRYKEPNKVIICDVRRAADLPC